MFRHVYKIQADYIQEYSNSHHYTRYSGRPANLRRRLDECKFTTTIVNHLLKVLGLVVSHSVFSPFYSRTPIMLNL